MLVQRNPENQYGRMCRFGSYVATSPNTYVSSRCNMSVQLGLVANKIFTFTSELIYASTSYLLHCFFYIAVGGFAILLWPGIELHMEKHCLWL